MKTTAARISAGFPPEPYLWNVSPAEYDRHKLRIAGQPVMEDWEASYMAALARVATAQGGHVLELGYGLGLSARAIQAASIERHVVIECHPDVLSRCLADCRDEIARGRLHLLSGFWQDVAPLLGSETFDGILFDTYPLSAAELHRNHFAFFPEAYRLLRPGGVLTYYSDEAEGFSPEHLAALRAAGFGEDDIGGEVCAVSPPEDCDYWCAPTLLVPIVSKCASSRCRSAGANGAARVR